MHGLMGIMERMQAARMSIRARERVDGQRDVRARRMWNRALYSLRGGSEGKESDSPTLPDDVWRMLVEDYVAPNDRRSLNSASKTLKQQFNESKKVVGWPSNAHIVTSVPLVDFALDHGWSWPTKTKGQKDRYAACTLVATVGNVKVMERARADKNEGGTPKNEWGAPTCAAAARGGHLEMLKWLHAHGCPWDEETSTLAARGGHLEMLKWARSEGCPWHKDEMCTEAARRGHLEVLKWLRAEGCPWNVWTCQGAARGGHLTMLKWLRDPAQGCPWDARTCVAAARNGHFDMLKWAIANDCPVPPSYKKYLYSYAVKGGHLEMIKWLHDKGSPPDLWDTVICTDAAEGGHLEVLKWLRAQGFQWDEETCRKAAFNGHFKVLKWLHANGCPWDVDKCLKAAHDYSNNDVIEWINSNP